MIVFLKVTATPLPVILKFKEEESYENPETGHREKFPSIDDPPSLDLSVVIPAFDEEQRCEYFFADLIQTQPTFSLISVPVMLEECLEFLEAKSKANKKFQYEIIVVSDGSRDGTVKKALEYSKRYSSEKFRVLELIQNRGKGGAVRLVSTKILIQV